MRRLESLAADKSTRTLRKGIDGRETSNHKQDENMEEGYLRAAYSSMRGGKVRVSGPELLFLKK